jgi:hypothetical protein
VSAVDGTIVCVDDARPGEQETSVDKETGGRWPLEGFFTCGSELLVVPECLGQNFQTRTLTYELTITLPELDAPDACAPLCRPPWKFNRAGEAPTASVDEEWGTVASGRTRNSDGTWPAYNAEVRQCIVATTVEAGNDEQFREAARVVAYELDLWWESVTDWLGVLTVQDFVGLGTQRRSILTYGFHAWSGDAEGIRRASTGSAMTVVPGRVEPLDRDQLQRAMDLGASGGRPPAEWLLIRDARSLLRAGDYRRAVIDAGSAAELAMTALVDRRLTNLNFLQKEKLFEKNRGLWELSNLMLKRTAGTRPDRFQKDLAEPRNEASHDGAGLSNTKANAAIAVAADLVEQAYPLANFTPSPTA